MGGKEKEAQAAAPAAFTTVKLSKKMHAAPDVRDGRVGDIPVSDYLTGLPDNKLAEEVISIGRQFKSFKDFFAAHCEWIQELRSRMPERGPSCKINVVDEGGVSVLYTWSEFCLAFFGVSARWVAKQQALYEGMREQPDIDKADSKEAGETGNKKESLEAVKEVYEEKIDRAETQAANLRLELGNLIAKIEEHKDEVPSEVYKAAMAAKFRVVPPPNAGADMNTGDLLDEMMNAVTASKSDELASVEEEE